MLIKTVWLVLKKLVDLVMFHVAFLWSFKDRHSCTWYKRTQQPPQAYNHSHEGEIVHTTFTASGEALSQGSICAGVCSTLFTGLQLYYTLALLHSLRSQWNRLWRLWRRGLGWWRLLVWFAHWHSQSPAVGLKEWSMLLFFSPSKCRFEEAPTHEQDSVFM